jgi:hypothetical protein
VACMSALTSAGRSASGRSSGSRWVCTAATSGRKAGVGGRKDRRARRDGQGFHSVSSAAASVLDGTRAHRMPHTGTYWTPQLSAGPSTAM